MSAEHPVQTNVCHIVTLPVELRLKVLEELDRLNDGNAGLRALGQTCTFFLAQLKHELYHTITLRADSRSGRSLQRITAGPRAALVKRLIFRARDPRPAWEKQHDPRYRLSVPSKQVLTFLHRFPNLHEFELDVDCKIDLWFSEHPEPRLYPIRGHSETYRFILDETLRALGRSVHHNNARALPKLTIRRLPPRTYRALVDHGLHAVLNDLRTFHIELPDQTNQPPPPVYHKFVSNMNRYFLHHLRNVRVLHLQASAASVVGEGHGMPAVDFADVTVPYLRKLKLENFVLGTAAESFVLRHLGTLYSVSLVDCYRDRSWSVLFRKVVAKKPSKLTRFEISEPPSMAGQETVSGSEDGADEQQPVGDEVSLRSVDDRAFPRVRTFCGRTWISREDESDERRSGHSMAAWRRLQGVVDANRRCWERFSKNKMAQ